MKLFSKNKDFAIRRLQSGGIITNYYCTSACGHCLYGCSPRWEKEYIDSETLRNIFGKIKILGCHAVHVGGGEPFLDLDGLKMVMEVARYSSVSIEYVETNSSWFTGIESAIRILSSLKKRGLSTLLISMSPFHNEHIPFYKVKGVIEACGKANINIFPWISEFYPEIDGFDDRATHSLSAYGREYGEDYLSKIPSRYWVHFGGRALKTFSGVYGTTDYREILSANKGGCGELQDVSHFHLDLFGNYIPGLCSGLAINHNDLGGTLSPEEYPVLTTLYRNGIAGLFDFVSSGYGFQPAGDYMSKCDLCFEIRRYLVLERMVNSRELQPKGFYENV